MSTPVLPDPLLAARTALLAQTAVTTSSVGTRIHFAIPETTTYPIWVLSLVDDDELRPETLTARVQVDVWGDGNTPDDLVATKASASVLRSVARDLRGAWSGSWGTASISNSVAGQIIPNPDTTGGRARYIVDLLLELNQ